MIAPEQEPPHGTTTPRAGSRLATTLLAALRTHRSSALLVVGLLLASTQFAHADLAYIAWKAHFVALGQLDVYRAIAAAAPERLVDATYPPLTYWVFGGWLALGRALFGILHRGFDLGAAWTSPVHLRHVDAAWFRLLYLPFLVWLGPLSLRTLRRLGVELGEHQPAVTLFVLAQPALLLPTFMIGQFDIMPAVLTLAGVLLLAEGAAYRGVLLLLAGAMLKLYPAGVLVAVAPVVFVIRRDPRFRRRLLGAVALAAAIVAVVLVALWGDSLRGSVLRLPQTGSSIRLEQLGIGVKTYVVVLCAVALAALPASARLFGERGIVGEARARIVAGLSEPAIARVTFFAATAAVAVLFVDRTWHTQFLVWTVPMFTVTTLYLVARARTTWPFAGLLVFTVAVVGATLVDRPRNYYLKGPFFLDGWPMWLRPPAWLPWSVVSAFCVLQIALALREIARDLAGEVPAVVLAPRAAAATRRQGAWLAIGFFSYAALHLVVGAT